MGLRGSRCPVCKRPLNADQQAKDGLSMSTDIRRKPLNRAQRRGSEPERGTYDVGDVAHILGISRNHAYAMAREGVFPIIKLGRRLVVPRARFDAWLSDEAE